MVERKGKRQPPGTTDASTPAQETQGSFGIPPTFGIAVLKSVFPTARVYSFSVDAPLGITYVISDQNGTEKFRVYPGTGHMKVEVSVPPIHPNDIFEKQNFDLWNVTLFLQTESSHKLNVTSWNNGRPTSINIDRRSLRTLI